MTILDASVLRVLSHLEVPQTETDPMKFGDSYVWSCPVTMHGTLYVAAAAAGSIAHKCTAS